MEVGRTLKRRPLLLYTQHPSVAGVAESADAPGLGPGEETRGGSTPLARTIRTSTGRA
jgi:hypothetical protein